MAQSISYLLLDVVMAVSAWILLRKHLSFGRRIFLVLIVMLILTVVFDNVMIACHLFTYSWAHTLGLRIGYAPIEDFAYPFVGTFLLIALWEGPYARTKQ